MILTIVGWIIFGLVIGFLANLVDPNPNRGGLVGNIILGIAGAIVGGLIARLIGIGNGDTGSFNLYSIVVSVLGSLLLLFIFRMVRRGTE